MPERILIFLIILLFIDLFAAALLYLRNRHHRIEKKELNAQIEVLKARIEKCEADINTRDDLIRNVGREIRTPMNAITCAVELISKESIPEGTLSYVNILKSSSDAMVTMLNDLVDYTMLESGNFTPIEEGYDIAQAIKEVADIISDKLNDRPISFIIDINPTLPRFLIGDVVRLKQIAIELLTNSVKYTEGGRIALSVNYERLSKNVLDLIIKIADTGCGIPPSEKENLIEEFRTAEQSGKFHRDGVSLGLILCRQLARNLGGDMKFESELGKGTVFTVKIREKIAEGDRTVCRNKASRNFGFDVLLYEDDPYYREGLKDIFVSLGLPFHEVNNDEDAVTMLSTIKIDFAFVSEAHVESMVSAIKRYSPITKAVKLKDIGGMDSVTPKNVYIMRKPVTVCAVEELLDRNGQIDPDEIETLGKLTTPDVSILLVDDNRVNLKVAKAIFESFNARVTAVDSGYEAVELVKLGEHFDIIFLDHMMPGMDGIETARRIREVPEYRTTPIIALTANTGGDVERLFFEAGLNDFLPKPIVMNHLVCIMQKWVPRDKQEFVTDTFDSPFLNKKKAVHFKPEKGLSRVWNDEKIFNEGLKIFEKESEDLIEEIYDKDKEELSKDALRELLTFSDSVGGVRMSKNLSELLNISEIGDVNLIKNKVEKIKEEYRILTAEIGKYLDERKEPDILTFV
jgi:signal transduction histidine kinase/DNA-binding response OmpR family regulator